MKRLFMSKRAAVVAAMLAMPAALAFTGTAEAAPVATETMTMLSGGGKSGESITVVEGTAVTNHATLTGANAASATGIVTYKVYSDQECTKEVASAGAMEVSAGTVPASNPQTLAPGTYYWQASYGGDENNEASASRCGSEVETVVDKPSVKARFTCTSVTYFFSNFPNAPNNTIRERIFVGTTLVYRGTYTFDGPTGSNTVAVNVPPGHHRVDAEASWNTNGVKGSKDMPAFQGVTCPPRVYVGYADSNPNQPNAHPTPWQGEAGSRFRNHRRR